MDGYLLYIVAILTMSGIYAILSLGLNVQWGYGGMMNAGIAGFFATGAYTMAVLTAPPQSGLAIGFGLPAVAGMAMAFVTSAALGLVIILLCAKLRTDYLAIGTLGIAEIVRLIAKNEAWLTGGNRGITGVPRVLEGLGATLDQYAFLGLVWACVIVIFWLCNRAQYSQWGRMQRAARDNESSAAAIGINVGWLRIQSFVFGAGIMGVAGALVAQYFRFMAPEATDPLVATFLVWVMVTAGGAGNNLGVILGAIALWTIWSFTGHITQQLPDAWAVKLPYVRLFLIGAALQFILVTRPKGFFSEPVSLTTPDSQRKAT